MLPEGWTYANLGEIASTVTSGSRDWAQYYSDAGDKFVRMTNLSRDGVRISENDMKYVAIPPDSSDGKRTSLKNGDILISITAELGKIGLVPKGFGTAFINQHLALVRLKNGTASSPFVAYALSSKKLNQKLNSLNDAGAKAGLNLSTIRSFPLALPPLPEQKKIAAILSTWDRAIEGTEKLLANSQQQKKALMQQLLTGKKRLPGFTGEWETRQINEIANRIKRRSDGQKHPILMISSSIGFVTQDAKYSRYMAGESVNNYILLKKGEFAYNKGNSKLYQFGCVFELREYKQGLVPNVYVCFKVNTEQYPAFYRHLFKFDFLKPQLRAIVNSGIRNNGLLNIKPDQFMNTKVPVPPLPEQKAIAAVLSTADEELAALESDLSRLRQEKKALMQQLLTGKRRVRVD